MFLHCVQTLQKCLHNRFTFPTEVVKAIFVCFLCFSLAFLQLTEKKDLYDHTNYYRHPYIMPWENALLLQDIYTSLQTSNTFCYFFSFSVNKKGNNRGNNGIMVIKWGNMCCRRELPWSPETSVCASGTRWPCNSCIWDLEYICQNSPHYQTCMGVDYNDTG